MDTEKYHLRESVTDTEKITVYATKNADGKGITVHKTVEAIGEDSKPKTSKKSYPEGLIHGYMFLSGKKTYEITGGVI